MSWRFRRKNSSQLPASTTAPTDRALSPQTSATNTPEHLATPQPTLDNAKEVREERQFYVDTSVKLIQVLALIASGGWAVEQYREQHIKDRELRNKELQEAQTRQRQEVEQRERALYLKFYEEQRPMYTDATRTAAEIAGAKRFADVQAAITRFRVLHFGPMCLVEDQEVLGAMTAFFEVLQNELASGAVQPSADLRNRSVFLARACRRSLNLKRVFNVDLPFSPSDLPRPKPTFP